MTAGQTPRERVRPVLALDIGASRLRAALVRPDGTLASRAEAPTRIEAGPDGLVADSVDLLNHVRDAGDPGAPPAEPIAVGIAAPGPLDASTGRLLEPPNLGPAFRGAPLAGPIGAALELPALLERDTNVALLAELAFGAARGLRDVLYITVSTGIGGAILTGGRLLTGPDGAAGELGHVVVDWHGPRCGCGAQGHLEALSSGVAIAREAREAIDRGRAPALAALARKRAPGPLTARDVAELEAEGDAVAGSIMDTARTAFAAAVVGLVDVFAPEAIVVGGGIVRGQGDRWLQPARDAVGALAFSVPAARVRIVPAALGDDVGLVGALGLVALRLPTP